MSKKVIAALRVLHEENISITVDTTKLLFDYIDELEKQQAAKHKPKDDRYKVTVRNEMIVEELIKKITEYLFEHKVELTGTLYDFYEWIKANEEI